MSEHNEAYYERQFADRRESELHDFPKPSTCWRVAHVRGCLCMDGGEIELRPGWVSMEVDGEIVEVEIR